MTTNRINNAESKGASHSLQPVILLFAAVFAAALLLAPFLPVTISNFIYSLSGEKPKIYWYLARSAGFITLTILWVAMALGLGITNKLARRWPGAPAAFATHQYVSLLGLGFTIYHALVLMGDHYTDFSLPRLLTPFSIAYKTFWVGLGQTGFYLWVIVVLSFYVRKYIGQSTWRLIHFANFAMYVFGFTHGIFSGWDTEYTWAQAYYWISGSSLLALLVYRLYQHTQDKRAARDKAAQRQAQLGKQAPAVRSVPTAVTSVPQVAAHQASTPQAPAVEQAPVPVAQAKVDVVKPVIATSPVASPAMAGTVDEAKHTASVKPEQVSAMDEAASKTQPARISPEPNTTPVRNNPIQPVPAPALRVTKIPRGSRRRSEQFPSRPHLEPALQIQVSASSKRTQSPWRKIFVSGPQVKGDQKAKQNDTPTLFIWAQDNPLPKPDPSPSLRVRLQEKETLKILR